LDGGSIALRSGMEATRRGSSSAVLSQSTLTRRDGAMLDIGGASAFVDLATGLGNFTPYLEWSAAGTISALGGGSLGITPINAHGGTAKA
ncbi:hypothetical protein, partial [Escherichia coli]